MLKESGVGRCKLPHLEWINKVQLYSIGNHTGYPVINHNGKEHLKQESIYSESLNSAKFHMKELESKSSPSQSSG